MAEKPSENPVQLFHGVQLKQTSNQGKGLFATKNFRSGEEVFRFSKPYAVGVGSNTQENLWEACHNCAKHISKGDALVCDRCRVAAFCSESCKKQMLRVHLAECQGLGELEKQRSMANTYLHLSSASDIRHTYWPPAQLLITARALNKKILNGMEEDSKEDISLISKGDSLEKEEAESILKTLRPLVLGMATDEMILNMYRCATSGGTGTLLKNSLIIALYAEFTFINHSCAPNCSQEDHSGQFVVCSLSTIKTNEQLSISYVDSAFRLIPGEHRRRKIDELYGFECKCDTCLSEQSEGSQLWHLDQMKKKAHASREIAEQAMEVGVKVISVLVNLRRRKEWAKIVDIANSTMQMNEQVLHPKNVINYILSRAIFEARFNLGQQQKAIETFKVIKESMKDYELERDVMKIEGLTALCYIQIGQLEEGRRIMRRIPESLMDIISSMAREGRVDMTVELMILLQLLTAKV